MTISRRNALLASLAGLVVAGVNGAPARAMTVYCTNCSTEVTELLEYAQIIDEVAYSLEQLNTQINMYMNMITNTLAIPNMIFGKVMGLYSKIKSVMNQGLALANRLANIDDELASKFQGYSSYSTSTHTTTTWKAKYTQWSDDTNEVVRTSLNTVKEQYDDIESEESDIAQMESAASSATGRLEALQAIAMLSATGVRQMQKMRILLGTQIQQFSQYMAQEQDKANVKMGDVMQYFQLQTIPTDDGQRF